MYADELARTMLTLAEDTEHSSGIQIIFSFFTYFSLLLDKKFLRDRRHCLWSVHSLGGYRNDSHKPKFSDNSEEE